MMENKNIIRIGYSSKLHESLVNDIKAELSNEIEIEADLEERYYSADAETWYPLVIGFSEWLLSNTSEYYFSLMLDKIRGLIKSDFREKKTTSVKLFVGYGDSCKVFKVDNVSEDFADKALNEFMKIATTQENINPDNTFNSNTGRFE